MKNLEFKPLKEGEINRELFQHFERRQEVNLCWRREDGAWCIKPDPFVDEWGEAEYGILVQCLQQTVRTGGLVLGGFLEGELKGFASVEAGPLGKDGSYRDLTSLHVSSELRRSGMGQALFLRAADWARQQGAVKLYISAHSAVETQSFYMAMGCVDAVEVQEAHMQQEPYDRQLEYVIRSGEDTGSGCRMQETGIQIREERETDYFQTEALVKRAFWNLYVPGCDEHFLAHEIRKHEDFIPRLSLVAESEEKKIVGMVMYTRSWLIEEDGTKKEILTFGPIAVEPSLQRCGIGKQLLERSFVLAAEMGYDAIVIFGSPANYIGRGFQSCLKYRVSLEDGSYPAAMLVKELKAGALEGKKWVYEQSGAFSVDPERFREFDRRFVQLEPGYQPSQEEFFIISHATLHAPEEG